MMDSPTYERGTHPNTIANLAATSAANKVIADERKTTFLQHFESFAFADPIVYPHIGRICRQLDIPYYTFTRWRQQDDKFAAEYARIEQLFNDAVVKVLFDATQTKWGVAYAISWLKAKWPSVWGDRMQHSGRIDHVNYGSRVWGYDPDSKIEDAQVVSTGTEVVERQPNSPR